VLQNDVLLYCQLHRTLSTIQYSKGPSLDFTFPSGMNAAILGNCYHTALYCLHNTVQYSKGLFGSHLPQGMNMPSSATYMYLHKYSTHGRYLRTKKQVVRRNKESALIYRKRTALPPPTCPSLEESPRHQGYTSGTLRPAPLGPKVDCGLQAHRQSQMSLRGPGHTLGPPQRPLGLHPAAPPGQGRVRCA